MRLLTKALSLVSALVLSATFASASTVNGTGPYFSTGSCALVSVSGGSTACYGAVSGNSNAQQVDVNNGIFYSGLTTASSSTTGLFGINEWYDYAKASSGTIASFGQTSGTFVISHDLTTPVAVLLKAGKTWTAHLYSGLSAGSYSFNLSGMTQNALSNIRVVAVVPVPAAAGMMLLGLGGLVLLRRRKGATVA